MIKLNNNRKSVALACLSLFCAILLLSYSAYAWFSASREVRAVGMNVNVNVANGLEISTEENGEYSDHIKVNLKDVVHSQIDKFDKDKDDFYLMPASSYDAMDFWYTTKANSLGQATCDADDFDKGQSIGYYAPSGKYEGNYVDITFWLRSATQESCAVAVNKATTKITPYDINSEDESENFKSVVRLGFLNKDKNQCSDGTKVPLVYSAQTQETSINVVTSGDNDKSKFVKPEYMKFNGSDISQRNVCKIGGAVYDNNGVTYGKTCVVVRVWIEGQDPKCVATIGGKQFEATIGLTAVENND